MEELPSAEPVKQKVLPPVAHDDSYRMRVERPCWFMEPPPQVPEAASEAERQQLASDQKEREVARVQWLFHQQRRADAARHASELLAAGAVEGCKLTRAEVAELEDIRAHCVPEHP